MVKNPPANAGDARNVSSIPRQEDPPRAGNGSSILAWKIPWTEESVGYTLLGHERVRRD